MNWRESMAKHVERARSEHPGMSLPVLFNIVEGQLADEVERARTEMTRLGHDLSGELGRATAELMLFMSYRKVY